VCVCDCMINSIMYELNKLEKRDIRLSRKCAYIWLVQ